mmetsp:Transcript_1299/g.3610  ORF Transcript_1299/g.3610 Transcript_1299/m.3610 type:complete len:219 (+) Transcript_1299:1-657(+)
MSTTEVEGGGKGGGSGRRFEAERLAHCFAGQIHTARVRSSGPGRPLELALLDDGREVGVQRLGQLAPELHELQLALVPCARPSRHRLGRHVGKWRGTHQVAGHAQLRGGLRHRALAAFQPIPDDALGDLVDVLVLRELQALGEALRYVVGGGTSPDEVLDLGHDGAPLGDLQPDDAGSLLQGRGLVQDPTEALPPQHGRKAAGGRGGGPARAAEEGRK